MATQNETGGELLTLALEDAARACETEHREVLEDRFFRPVDATDYDWTRLSHLSDVDGCIAVLKLSLRDPPDYPALLKQANEDRELLELQLDLLRMRDRVMRRFAIFEAIGPDEPDTAVGLYTGAMLSVLSTFLRKALGDANDRWSSWDL